MQFCYDGDFAAVGAPDSSVWTSREGVDSDTSHEIDVDPIKDDLHGRVIHFNDCASGGDIYSKTSFDCSSGCTVSAERPRLSFGHSAAMETHRFPTCPVAVPRPRTHAARTLLTAVASRTCTLALSFAPAQLFVDYFKNASAPPTDGGMYLGVNVPVDETTKNTWLLVDDPTPSGDTER